MSERCPVCNGVMVSIPTRIVPSGWDLKKYRCEQCKVTARVETTYSCDADSEPASQATSTAESK